MNPLSGSGGHALFTRRVAKANLHSRGYISGLNLFTCNYHRVVHAGTLRLGIAVWVTMEHTLLFSYKINNELKIIHPFERYIFNYALMKSSERTIVAPKGRAIPVGAKL